jgi:indolepyruvate ferredoxin oxidoreductase alpha subunit
MEVRLLRGNEAIARGAVEAGVKVVVGYPGTPSSEVIETLIPHAEKLGIRVEWSVNEKVAFDIGTGVAYGGYRSLITMKMSGLNVASDSIISAAYGGVEGGLVIYVADDPSTHSGMVEQDSRFFTHLSLLPMIDVFDPQNAKEAVVEAFQVSEEFKIPVLVRSTSNVAHMKGEVTHGPIKGQSRVGEITRDIRRFMRASPAWCMEQHNLLNKKNEKLREKFELSKLNELDIPENSCGLGVIVSGISWNYLKETMTRHELDTLATLRIGTTNPLPKNLITALLKKTNEILVLEELEPYLELHVKALIGELGKQVRVVGKGDGTLSRVGEYTPEIVEKAIGKLMGKNLFTEDPEREMLLKKLGGLVPGRELPFCPGCPHRGTYTAMRQALKELGCRENEVIITGDIGCTILGMHPPFNMCWNEVSMGASIGLATGYNYAEVGRPIIATIGDSTFFHAGIPPAINAAIQCTDIVIAILDNRITAMTGHQPSPTSTFTMTGEKANPIKIEEVLKSVGIEKVRIADPYELKSTKEAFIEALKQKGPSAIILRQTCPQVKRKMVITEKTCTVTPETCKGCFLCIRTLCCPAMNITDDRKTSIDIQFCNGCELCAQICPFDAISRGDV